MQPSLNRSRNPLSKQLQQNTNMKKLLSSLLAVGVVSLIPGGARAADEAAAETTQIKGEILDLACYTDHGASGEKHAGCAEKCISSGLPVGIKGEDGKVYLVVGAHKPLNAQLAPEAGKTVTLQGKVKSRDGINLLENAEIVTK